MNRVLKSATPTAALLLLVLLAAAAVKPAAAQQPGTEVPRIESAEELFGQALAAYEGGDYDLAARRFRLVADDFPLHRKTTAALLMGGRAWYRQGAYGRAAEWLERLLDDHPTSSYRDEARRTLRLVDEARSAEAGRPRVIDLGILLPMGADTTSLTQELFDGIRLAVDAFNEGATDVRVRMHYRGTGGPEAVADSVRALAEAGADLIVGPLYSETAVPAARAAEATGTLLVAPLATDARVSEGRDLVFQANPTIAMRGRQMARFAARSLRMDTVGVVAERGSALGEEMARAFVDEAAAQEMGVLFDRRLPGARGWYDLAETLDPALLRRVEAVYMPVAGRRAQRYIGAALTGLSRLNVETRVLGNAEWHDLPMAQQAGEHHVTYSNDFYVDPDDADVRAFTERYRALADAPPGRLAFTGYDLTRFLLSTLQDAEPRRYAEALRRAPRYEGLGLRFEFEGGQVNHALFFHAYRFGRNRLLR